MIGRRRKRDLESVFRESRKGVFRERERERTKEAERGKEKRS